MTPDALIELFTDTANAVHRAVYNIERAALRDRTDRPGQYALDLVADAAACAILEPAKLRVVSEESGVHAAASSITIVIDPVDGSTNCARGIAYWATSICALDNDGPLAALVVNQATQQRTIAIRDAGATRDGIPLRASTATALVGAVVGLGGLPQQHLGWKQSRALGCCSLMLCDVAAGGLDAYFDPGAYHAPWDYLGGALACTEAGAMVRDVNGAELAIADTDARRQLIAAGTRGLCDAIEQALR